MLKRVLPYIIIGDVLLSLMGFVVIWYSVFGVIWSITGEFDYSGKVSYTISTVFVGIFMFLSISSSYLIDKDEKGKK